MTEYANADRYHGKTIDHFEDEYRVVLDKLYMITDLIIVFTDGSKIKIEQEWFGTECWLKVSN